MAKIVGDDGANVIEGTSGNDEIRARGGDDVVRAGVGKDLIYADGGNDKVYADSGYDFIVAGGGRDLVSGGTGNDTLRGGGGADRLSGDSGADGFFGDAGSDRILGGEGDDAMSGGDGNDRLFGGAGADQLAGNAGDDVLTGDDPGGPSGADIFYFSRFGFETDTGGHDLVADFQHHVDRLYLKPGFDFAALDTNGDGELGKGDERVSVREVTFEGHTAESTVLDLSGAPGAGKDVLTVFGVTGIDGQDFFTDTAALHGIA